ncbi:jg23560 [Pararge aegeria aegeria]|uniref:Jg23560 protein n=1 Tax=Pararge aegeria aegeria TaxID=348720 RepID=A0A8S4RXZ5_9NEOP|nr:jg23560 [Pararge aegeria aegeria]
MTTDRTDQNRPKQNRPEQTSTEKNRTEQYRTRQNRTDQDKHPDTETSHKHVSVVGIEPTAMDSESRVAAHCVSRPSKFVVGSVFLDQGALGTLVA